MKTLAFVCCWLWSLAAVCGEVIPPVPAQYFNDYAHIVSAATAAQLNAKLEDFERTTGNQILVAIYPKMQSDSSIDDYAVRVARAWKVGQKSRNNGAVLFVFMQSRQMFVATGYGLEGALPDGICKQITEFEMKPHFKAGDYAGGLTAGVEAILAAARHEYKGTGATVYEAHARHAGNWGSHIVIIIFVAIVLLQLVFGRAFRRHGWMVPPAGDGAAIQPAAGWAAVDSPPAAAASPAAVSWAVAAVSAAGAPAQVGDMKARHFLSQLQHDAIVRAIGEAEAATSGEIRLFVSRKEPEDAVAAAQRVFAHLGMDKTRERNGVLLFIAPRAHKFAIIGDKAVHEKCGDEFWKEVAHEISVHFRRGDFTDGILHGIRRAGQLLAQHFPRHPGDQNQLPDEIAHD